MGTPRDKFILRGLHASVTSDTASSVTLRASACVYRVNYDGLAEKLKAES